MKLEDRYTHTDKEIAGNNKDDNADVVNAAPGNNAAPNNGGYATMPPKVKPIPRNTVTKSKRESVNVDEMPPPAPHIVANFFVDSNNKFLVSYYCEGSHNYADMSRDLRKRYS